MARQPSRRSRSATGRLRSAVARTLRIALVAVVLLTAISLTVGTGIAPIDGAVDDAYAGLQDVVSGDSGSPTAGADDGTINATTDRARLELAIHERVNEARTERGLDALSFDVDLREIARNHSADMAERDYFSHTSPEGEGLQDRYDRFGYDCRVPAGAFRYKGGGENLFTIGSAASLSNEALADRAVEGWLNSPAHRENLLDGDWRREGVGVATASDGAIYVTQNFC